MGFITEDIDWWNEKLTPNQIIWDREYRDSLKWHDVSKMQNMPVDYIREFKDELDWTILARNTSVNEQKNENLYGQKQREEEKERERGGCARVGEEKERRGKEKKERK